MKDCAKAIVDYIYKLDEFESIIERIEIMDQSIKINTGNTDGLLPRRKLVTVYVRTSIVRNV